MKNLFNKNSNDDTIFFRLKNQKLEDSLKRNHQFSKEQIAIPLGRTLAQMSPCMPEPECEDFSSILEIETRYRSQMREAEVELQTNIQPEYIKSENGLADDEISDLSSQKQKLDNNHRIAQAEVDRCNKAFQRKAKRYNWRIRPLLIITMMLDMLLSGSALESAGLAKGMAYGVGLILGIGIFFLAERLPQIIDKGRTTLEKKIIAISIFSICFIIFYFLGELRVLGFSSGTFAGSHGISPIYFASMNMFMMLIVVIISYFTKPNKEEQVVIDTYKTRKKDVTKLDSKIKNTGDTIKNLKITKARQELTRTQITHYADYIRNLIQGYFEESVRSFQTTNRMYRMDGKTPAFFKYDVPQLPKIKVDIKSIGIKKALLIVMAFGLISCGSDPVNIAILEDVTELDFLARPDHSRVTSTFGLEADPWKEVTFRYGVLSSLGHTKREILSLPSEQSLMGNTIERKAKVDHFNKNVHKLLTAPRDSNIHTQSSIWIPIVEELKILQSLSSNSYLYIYSDLAENSPLFSIKNREDVRKLASDPDEIKTLFLDKAKDLMPSSDRIQVIVVYQPRTIEEDRAFMQMKELFSQIFLDLEISISFVSNL